MKALTLSDFEQLNSKPGSVRLGFAKSLLQLASSKPEEVYPFFDEIVKMLDSKNQILKWIAIDCIGLLSNVDHENRTYKFVDPFIRLLSPGHLITANHAIFALSHIVKARLQDAPKILAALLNVEKNTYETDECRNIVIGKVIEVLPLLPGIIGSGVTGFLKHASNNSRNATRKKAEKLLNRMQKQGLAAA